MEAFISDHTWTCQVCKEKNNSFISTCEDGSSYALLICKSCLKKAVIMIEEAEKK